MGCRWVRLQHVGFPRGSVYNDNDFAYARCLAGIRYDSDL